MIYKIIASLAAFSLTIAGIVLYQLGTMNITQCQKTFAEESGVHGEINHQYFSSSYAEARTRFIEAAQATGSKIESIPNPHTGPKGKSIFMDVVLLGDKDAQRTLVVISGTHGVEGFAGSAIQTGILSEEIGSQLHENTSLLMIHALNPYGMAHLRRFTEDNVDLNRNFRDPAELLPTHPAYEQLADVIAPQSMSFWSGVVSWSQLLWFRLTEGKAATQAVISGGQYSHPDGLFYGGASDTWSNKTLRSIIQRYLAHVNKVIVIDVHTGLGKFGAVEIILNVPENSPEYRRAITIWKPKMAKTTVTCKSVSTHLPTSLKLAIPKMLPKAEVTAVSLEFGTLPPMDVFKALRAENWLHHYGGNSPPKAAALKTCLLQAFYPGSEEWELSVWNQGKLVIEQALASLNSP